MTGAEWIKEQEADEAEANETKMTVTYWVTDTEAHTLAFEVADLEELIYRCGWTITNDIQNQTDEAREEIRRLNDLEYIEGKFHNNREGAIEWWNARRIS